MKKLGLFLMLLSPVFAKAQAFSTGFLGNKQHAMGNAGTGLALDGATNPAAAFFFNGTESKNVIGFGVGAARSLTAYLDSANFSTNKTNSGVGTPFYLYGIWGPGESSSLSKLKFFIGLTTPYGANLSWPDDWTGRNVTTKKSLSSIVVTPGVAYKLNDKIAVSVGFAYAYSNLKVEKGLPFGVDSKVNLDFKQRGFGFGGSVFYQATEKLSLGLAYQSEVTNKSYKGTATFTTPSSLAPLFPNGSVSTQAKTPHVLALGVGYKLSEKLLLGFDVNYSLWKSFDSTIFIFDTKTAAVQDSRTPNLYKNTYALRLGGQYMITESIAARAGVSYEPTPIPDNLIHPDGPDANRLNLTIGAGYKLNDKFLVDVSYRFTNLQKRVAKNDFYNMNGVYKTYGHVFGIGMSYIF